MKIIQVKIKNFRSYANEVIVDFEDLTAFVGKNDIGKSTILEALDIFFDGGVIKIDKNDINK
ncbi:AAA family ATPase, partial [Campylobacter coli]